MKQLSTASASVCSIPCIIEFFTAKLSRFLSLVATKHRSAVCAEKEPQNAVVILFLPLRSSGWTGQQSCCYWTIHPERCDITAFPSDDEEAFSVRCFQITATGSISSCKGLRIPLTLIHLSLKVLFFLSVARSRLRGCVRIRTLGRVRQCSSYLSDILTYSIEHEKFKQRSRLDVSRWKVQYFTIAINHLLSCRFLITSGKLCNGLMLGSSYLRHTLAKQRLSLNAITVVVRIGVNDSIISIRPLAHCMLQVV